MKEYSNGDIIQIGSTEQCFKVKVTTAGTASIQLQASNEGFDEITDGNFTATGFGIIKLANCQIKPVLTGDAQFFMGLASNRF